MFMLLPLLSLLINLSNIPALLSTFHSLLPLIAVTSFFYTLVRFIGLGHMTSCLKFTPNLMVMLFQCCTIVLTIITGTVSDPRTKI